MDKGCFTTPFFEVIGVKGVRFIWEPVQLAMQRQVEQNSAVWPGGGVEDVLLGVETGRGKQLVVPRQLGADRNDWVLKGVLFFVAAEIGVFDGVGGAV